MKKQFTTYEIALALKELGFDERCLGHFDIQSKVLYVGDTEMNVSVLSEILLPAPLWQQAIDWLRTIGISITFRYFLPESYSYVLHPTKRLENFKKDYYDRNIYDGTEGYLKASEAAILEAIKIVKGEPK